MAGSGGRSRPAAAIVCAVAGILAVLPSTASAYDLKQTSQGLPLRWALPRVDYVVDPSVEASVSGGTQAVSAAIAAWSGAAGAPALSVSVGPGGATAGLDGQNSVLLAPQGFAPAGDALAVTVTSYEESTGAIVDADIVINGIYSFAVLTAGALPPGGTSPISTDGSSSAGAPPSADVFDLVHVASHETGHSLGLADVPNDSSALMYAFTMPDDASVRAPTSDDIAGVGAIYGATAAATTADTLGSRAGCGQSSVAAFQPHRDGDAWATLLLVAATGLGLAWRRSRALRAAAPVGAALVVFVLSPAPARSAPMVATAALGDASAQVVSLSTVNVGGVFETTVDLATGACRAGATCPPRARAHLWGGTLNGITQQLGGQAVPHAGDQVRVQFSRPAPGAAETDVAAATLVGWHG